VPAGLLDALKHALSPKIIGDFEDDPVSRAATELAAMESVMAAEAAAGREPRDVSKQNLGYDIESRHADGTLRFIEVKGRAAGARDLILTQNEVRAALNAPERWWLAVVEIENGFARAPAFLRDLGLREPAFAETAVVLNIQALMARQATAA